MPLFGRHAREFGKAIARQEWERTREGIWFPRQRALLHGHVTMESRGGRIRFPNILLLSATDLQALNAPGGTAAVFDGKYVALWGNDFTPTLAWLAPYLAQGSNPFVQEYTLWTTMGELGDGPEGYDETTRPAWVWADAGAGLIDNSASPAAFTMATASTIDVYGIAICGLDTKLAGKPVDSFGVSGQYSQLDMGNCHFPEIIVNSSLYVPTGAVNNGTGGEEDTLTAGGPTINIDPSAHPSDPNQYPKRVNDLGDVTNWFDPSGDDYFDTGSNFWVDPSGDSFAPTSDPLVPLFAAARVPSAPATFNNGDPLNITWGVQLS